MLGLYRTLIVQKRVERKQKLPTTCGGFFLLALRSLHYNTVLHWRSSSSLEAFRDWRMGGRETPECSLSASEAPKHGHVSPVASASWDRTGCPPRGPSHPHSHKQAAEVQLWPGSLAPGLGQNHACHLSSLGGHLSILVSPLISVNSIVCFLYVTPLFKISRVFVFSWLNSDINGPKKKFSNMKRKTYSKGRGNIIL